MGWNTFFALIRIHEGPHESPEVRRRKIGRSFEDAFSDEQIASVVAIPDGRLPVYKASAYGIRHPDALPLARHAKLVQRSACCIDK